MCIRDSICLVSTADICPVSAADICPVSTADICPVSTEDIYPVSTENITAAGRRPAASRLVFCSGKLWLAQCVRCLAGSTRRRLTRGEESEEGGDSVSTEDITAAGRRPAAVASSVETG